MSLVFGILTSNNVELFRISLNSVMDQIISGTLKTSIIVAVNSTDDDYYNKINDVIKTTNNKCDIYKTSSNGKPGKGHNELINIFKTRTEDYLYILDGDDFLYKTATITLDRYINNTNVDMLNLIISDNIVRVDYKHRINNIIIPNGSSIEYVGNNIIQIDSYDYLIDNPYNCMDIKWSNPFNGFGGKNGVGVMGRLILLSRRCLPIIPENLYDEDMHIYDDVGPMLYMINNYQNPNIKIVYTYNSNILLYNNINVNSVSKTNEPYKIIEDSENVKKYISVYNALYNNFNNMTSIISVLLLDDKYIKRTNLYNHKGIFIEKLNNMLHNIYDGISITGSNN